MFEAAGVARTERSITNWCQPNKMGMTRLDSYFDPNERKYYISPQSVELAIQEEKAKAAKGAEVSGSVRSFPNDSEPAKQNIEPLFEDEESKIQELEREILDLRITNRGKDYLIEEFRKERTTFAEERRMYVEELKKHQRQIGQLETRLLQLEAPEIVSLKTPESGSVEATAGVTE
jgi:hypothetical protein